MRAARLSCSLLSPARSTLPDGPSLRTGRIRSREAVYPRWDLALRPAGRSALPSTRRPARPRGSPASALPAASDGQCRVRPSHAEGQRGRPALAR